MSNEKKEVDLKRPLREKLLGCKVTEDEYKEVEDKAEKHEVSVSRYLRFKIFGKQP
jgi:hypothetical protein